MTKELIKARLKERMKSVTNKFNVSIYDGEFSDENAALLLFSDFLTKSLIGLDFVLSNGFDENKEYVNEHMVVCNHLYSSSLLYYSKMFRGGKGVKRESIKLREKVLFDNEGNEKKATKIKLDRFYIEEFFKHNDAKFKQHHSILYKVDKSIVHIDKTNLNNSFMLLIFDKINKSKYLGVDNHFDYLMLPDFADVLDIFNVVKCVRDMVDVMVGENTLFIHNKLSSENDYAHYYNKLFINENEL